jgi:two-component system phosphate regulon sensor histidine kinase PhoR
MITAGRKIRLLTIFIIAYLLMAFAWWSVLLYTKNKDAFEAKAELLRIGMVAEGIYTNEKTFQQSASFQELNEKYTRQEWMILGEASLFILSLVIGIWLMNRGFVKEINVAGQQRNFLLSITHELKSPLAGIKLVLETFKKRTLNEEQTRQLTHNALQDTERLNTLVNNLLMAARIEDAYEISLEPHNLNELIDHVIYEIHQRHPSSRIDFKPEKEFLALIEPGAMHIVLINLLENAIKYSQEDHKIIEISLVQSDQYLNLCISDNGIGIPDKEKENVFMKFYRVGSEDTRSTKGTGLGLYIVKGIIEAHKGKIKIEDRIPNGSKFIVSLPKV